MERAVEKCLQDSAKDGDSSPIVAEECQTQVFDIFSKILWPSKGRTGRSLRSKAESLAPVSCQIKLAMYLKFKNQLWSFFSLRSVQYMTKIARNIS